MTDFHEEVPVSAYGAQRREAWLAGLRANANMADRAAVAAHGQTEDHRTVQAGQAGLFGHLTPEDRGAAVAAQQARVGEDWGGGGRALEARGGLDWESQGAGAVAPIPPRADMRFVHQPAGPPASESPLAAWLRDHR